tara:strand:- start:20180 stop:20638 length:459 start_codon:yes stop_codon:yes gene_type:complete
MLSLLGSLLGFGTSFLPKVMDYFQDKQDKAHEIKLMVEQSKIQLQIGKMQLQQMTVEGDVKEIEATHKEQASTILKGSRWLANLSGSIRPVLTYAFTVEYLVVTWSIAYLMIGESGVTIETLQEILDDEFMGLYSAMVSFWFGNRTFGGRKS